LQGDMYEVKKNRGGEGGSKYRERTGS